MPDIDRLLSPLLDRPLADPEPMAELQRRARRARGRRRATQLGTGATAIAAVVLLAALWPGRAAQEVHMLTPPASAPSQGGPSEYVERIRPDQLVLIGGGSSGGLTWQLLAGYNDTGDLCMELRHGAERDVRCFSKDYAAVAAPFGRDGGAAVETRAGPGAPVDPSSELTAYPVFAQMGSVPFLWDAVSRDVAKIRLELRDGQRIDVAVMTAEAPFTNNFYAAPVGQVLVEYIVALDAGDRELGRQWVPPVPASVKECGNPEVVGAEAFANCVNEALAPDLPMSSSEVPPGGVSNCNVNALTGEVLGCSTESGTPSPTTAPG